MEIQYFSRLSMARKRPQKSTIALKQKHKKHAAPHQKYCHCRPLCRAFLTRKQRDHHYRFASPDGILASEDPSEQSQDDIQGTFLVPIMLFHVLQIHRLQQ